MSVNAPAVQPADAQARRRAGLIWVLCALIGAVAIAWLERHIPALQSWLLTDQQKLPERLNLAIWIMTAAASLPLFVLSAWLWRLAHRITAVGRFPLPGQAVVRDTPIREGASALAFARRIRLFAGCFFFAALAVAALLWRARGILGDTAY